MVGFQSLQCQSLVQSVVMSNRGTSGVEAPECPAWSNFALIGVARIDSPIRGGIPGVEHRLVAGRNIVGRSAVPVPDRWFINIESPKAAVSRAHAMLLVTSTGDAWIEDNCSTNGTFVFPSTVAAGEALKAATAVDSNDDAAQQRFSRALLDVGGIRLDRQHVYQVKPGNHIVFGDCEFVFDAWSGPRPSGAAIGIQAASPRRKATASQIKSGAASQRAAEKSVGTPERVDGAIVSSSLAGDADAEVARSTRKRDRAVVEPSTPEAGRRTKTETTKGFVACLSGVDSASRPGIQKLIIAHGGVVSEEWCADCDAVIVKDMVTGRTPKLLMAVGNGRHVVAANLLSVTPIGSELFNEANCSKFTPSVELADGRVVSQKTLLSAIRRHRSNAALLGKTFSLGTDIKPKSTREVYGSILKACGAAVTEPPLKSKAASPNCTVLSDQKSVDAVFDVIFGS